MNDSVFNVVVTNECNASCPYCISEQTPEVCKDYSEFNFCKFYKAIQYAERSGILTCKLTGKRGDPLCCDKEAFQIIMSYVRERFPILELQTNGTLLNEEKVKWLKGTGINLIAISCVHYEESKNTDLYGLHYPNLIEVVDLLHKYGLSVRLSCTLIKGYIDDHFKIDEFLEYFKGSNIEQFSFIPVGHNGDNIYAQWAKQREVRKHIVYNNIKANGTLLRKTPYGGLIYDYEGKNVYIADCLSGTVEGIRSLIFYPDGHLRYSWTKPGAIIF